jgi:hypothetical protein
MKLFFEMMIVDEYGFVHGRRRVEISRDAAYIGNRAVDDMKLMNSLGAGSMSATVEMMRVREFRKKLLTSAAAQCGTALAEHLEDREGWHGLDRQERVEAQYNPQR